MPTCNGDSNCRRVSVQPRVPLPLTTDQLRPSELCQNNGESLKPHTPFVRGNCVERMFDRDTGNRHRAILAPLSTR